MIQVLCIMCLLTGCSTKPEIPEEDVQEIVSEETEIVSEEPEVIPEDIVNEADGEAPEEEESEVPGITAEEYEAFQTDSQEETAEEFGSFDDFSDTMAQDFTGTWYDSRQGEAIRLTEEGAYVYIPLLNLYGDVLYEWELIDRSERGLCPELAIYISGRDSGPLAYYVAGVRENYFWCNIQSQIFYRQN